MGDAAADLTRFSVAVVDRGVDQVDAGIEHAIQHALRLSGLQRAAEARLVAAQLEGTEAEHAYLDPGSPERAHR